MTQKSEIGKKGENIACEYLKKHSYKIIERNFIKPWGEIDVVAFDQNRTLVFVEVKTMSGIDSDSLKSLVPEDQMTKSKYLKTVKIATSYANKNPELIDQNRGWRIDLLAIKIQNDVFDIKHYQNVSV